MTLRQLLPPSPLTHLHCAQADLEQARARYMAAPYSLTGSFDTLDDLTTAEHAAALASARWHAHATCQECGEACAARPAGLPDLCGSCQQGRDADFVTEEHHVHD